MDLTLRNSILGSQMCRCMAAGLDSDGSSIGCIKCMKCARNQNGTVAAHARATALAVNVEI